MSRSSHNAKRLKQAVIRLEGQPYKTASKRRAPRFGPGLFLAITTSTISARSTTTPGAGTVAPVTYDGTSLNTGTDSINVLQFSGSSTTIASGKYCVVAELSGGNFIISVEC